MVGNTGCAQKLWTLYLLTKAGIIFYFLFMKTATSAASYYVPNVIFACVWLDTGEHLDFLNKTILSKNYPHPLKPEAMEVYVKCLNGV